MGWFFLPIKDAGIPENGFEISSIKGVGGTWE
jgi:hypothetical protein